MMVRTALLSSLVRAAILLLGLAALPLGCTPSSGTPPRAVSEGRFVLYIDGAVRDTLTGAASLRIDDGVPVGLELDASDTHGVSVDLQPQPLALGTYTVIDDELLRAERPGDTPGLVAFLQTDVGTFQATAGQLRVSYVEGTSILGGTLSWTMEGALEGTPVNQSTVQVEGQVYAVAP
jgi:hypothetical protein